MARTPVSEPDFEQLVEGHYVALFRFGLSLAKSESEAADLTQQTFYLWAAKGHQLRDKSKVKTWLFTTLYREFLGGRRRHTSHPEVEFSSVESEMPPIQSSVVETLDGRAVVAALQRVDEIYRAPLQLFYLESLSYKEIDDVLEVPSGTVMSRLSRGKEQLRAMLSDSVLSLERKVVPMTPAPAAQQSP